MCGRPQGTSGAASTSFVIGVPRSGSRPMPKARVSAVTPGSPGNYRRGQLATGPKVGQQVHGVDDRTFHRMRVTPVSGTADTASSIRSSYRGQRSKVPTRLGGNREELRG